VKWLTGVLIIALCLVVFLVVNVAEKTTEDSIACEKAGGEFVRLYRSTLCLEKGVIIHMEKK